jgi:hypothetical protein
MLIPLRDVTYIHAKLTGSAFMSYGESGETSPVRVARYTVSAAAAVTPDRLCDRDEFDDIDAPLASFDFGYERLRLTKPVRQFLLDDPGILPRLLKQREQAGVIRGVKGLAHAPPGGEAPSKLILKPARQPI